LASEALLEEYATTFWRPQLAKLHGYTADQIPGYLASIRALATVIEPPPCGIAAPDPGDQHLWDLLAEIPDAILVTGDAALPRNGDFPGRILTPREVAERFEL
jgi:uncharacterized protein